MPQNPIQRVDTLTFDIFGTVLDLTNGIVPTLDGFLAQKRAAISGADLWTQWRARQRIEQYQDTIVMLGHSGYRARPSGSAGRVNSQPVARLAAWPAARRRELLSREAA